MKEFLNAIERIKNIKVVDKDSWEEKESFHLLINEFIRRENIFRDLFESEKKSRIVIFKASQVIGAEIPKKINQIIEGLNLNPIYGGFMEIICEAYLEWMYLYDIKNSYASKYKDLYEPIILLFERGGRFFYHNQELFCGRYSWPKNCYSLFRNSQELNLDSKELDKIDFKR